MLLELIQVEPLKLGASEFRCQAAKALPGPTNESVRVNDRAKRLVHLRRPPEIRTVREAAAVLAMLVMGACCHIGSVSFVITMTEREEGM
jgi:hypothetical protein